MAFERSPAGKWDYSAVAEPVAYGTIESYEKAAAWLNDCDLVEDRGCGTGFARQFIKGGYRGVDGSPSKWTEVVVDLLKYSHPVPGILLRHVLEHNVKWPMILQNAVTDFQHRLAIVIHIPLCKTTDRYLDPTVFPTGNVPNIQMCKYDFMVEIAPFLERMEVLSTGEILFCLER